MTLHLLFITIRIEKRRKSAAEKQHELAVQTYMEERKEQQAFHCRLF